MVERLKTKDPTVEMKFVKKLPEGRFVDIEPIFRAGAERETKMLLPYYLSRDTKRKKVPIKGYQGIVDGDGSPKFFRLDQPDIPEDNGKSG